MANDDTLSREDFDVMAANLGLDREPGYLDELYFQVRGIFIGARSLRAIDVSDTEPDMAFIPADG